MRHAAWRRRPQDMQNQRPKNTLPTNGDARHAEHAGVLRFARRLDHHRDLDRLLQALPTELGTMTVCSTTAVAYQFEGAVSWHVTGTGGHAAPPPPSIAEWQETILPLVYGPQRKLVLSSLDRETRFPETTKFFRARGNQSLCVLPLNTAFHRLGAICFGREYHNAFAEGEVSFLSLIGQLCHPGNGRPAKFFAHSDAVHSTVAQVA